MDHSGKIAVPWNDEVTDGVGHLGLKRSEGKRRSLTDDVGQNPWDTVLAPRPVAHDELTGEAMHCVHSLTGQSLCHGATRVMRHLGGSSATLSQWL